MSDGPAVARSDSQHTCINADGPVPCRSAEQWNICPPLGQGRLVAILADPESEVAKVLDRHRDLETIKDLRTYLSDVAAGLRQPQRDGFARRLPDWTMHAVEYEIVQ